MKFKHIFIIVLILFAFSSCEDFLELKKPGAYTDATYFAGEKEAEELIITLYSIHMKGYPFNYMFSLSLALDARTADGDETDTPEWHNITNIEIYSHQQTPENGAVTRLWRYFYDGITRANIALQKLENIEVTGNIETGFSSVEKKNSLMAEARCFRALYYSYLAKLWGNVPLMDKPLNANNYRIAKSTQEEVFKFIYKDLNYASAHLPLKANTIPGRLTKGVAMYLKSQNLIWQSGTDAGHENWEVAFEITDSLVNGPLAGEYKLLDSYGNIWMQGNDFNDETIYEIVQSTNGQFRHDFLIYAYPRYVKGPDGKRKSCWGYGAVGPTKTLVDAFEKHGEPGDPDYWEDPRLGYSIWREGEIVPIGENDNANLNDSLEVYLKDSPTGHYMKKYWLNSEPSTTNADLNIKVFRYADVVLSHAECAYYIGEEGIARESLEKIRSRAREGNPSILPEVTASGQELLTAIWHERRVELNQEQLRWFDIQRQGKVKEEIERQTFPFNPDQHFVYQKGREYFPIPQTDIDLNPNLVQNPGY